ncbi:hypothetical protein FIBSPDRAFT_65629 [Athelia psychrophila]|uniref:Uncharacterized protein n=1 Tax=Athelia psychrophila TaxID=1759441 RepID=A0A166EX50_9AGAM|nr:hypothetical protein FIBSPDRAFT_65629 [Fibularhizoctonia sp. CBS 109695]
MLRTGLAAISAQVTYFSWHFTGEISLGHWFTTAGRYVSFSPMMTLSVEPSRRRGEEYRDRSRVNLHAPHLQEDISKAKVTLTHALWRLRNDRQIPHLRSAKGKLNWGHGPSGHQTGCDCHSHPYHSPAQDVTDIITNGPRLAELPTNALHPSGFPHMTAQAQILFELNPGPESSIWSMSSDHVSNMSSSTKLWLFIASDCRGVNHTDRSPHHDPCSVDRSES